MLKSKIVRVRWVKPYPSAHNHIAIGEVIAETNNYLVLLCKTYHFGDSVGGKKTRLRCGEYVQGVLEGEKATRIVPWHRIEIMHELPSSTDWQAEAFINESGACYLHNEHKTIITRTTERNE